MGPRIIALQTQRHVPRRHSPPLKGAQTSELPKPMNSSSLLSGIRGLSPELFSESTDDTVTPHRDVGLGDRARRSGSRHRARSHPAAARRQLLPAEQSPPRAILPLVRWTCKASSMRICSESPILRQAVGDPSDAPETRLSLVLAGHDRGERPQAGLRHHWRERHHRQTVFGWRQSSRRRTTQRRLRRSRDSGARRAARSAPAAARVQGRRPKRRVGCATAARRRCQPPLAHRSSTVCDG